MDEIRPDLAGKILSIEKIVLKKEIVKDFDWFRLRSYPQTVIVSEKFKKMFEENQFTGHSFIEVEVSG